jgi:LytS/YehU family sensor histidine kinase
LVVTDNGPGLQGNSGKRGLGFSLTKERLERLYDAKQQLKLLDVPEGGLKVTLEIPFSKEHAKTHPQITQITQIS